MAGYPGKAGGGRIPAGMEEHYQILVGSPEEAGTISENPDKVQRSTN